MPSKVRDEEFSPEILRMLRSRDVLGRSNPAQLVPLWYNAYTEAETIVQRFQDARRLNPLLETTPGEAWLAAEIIPVVQGIRAGVAIAENALDAGLQTYLSRRVQLVERYPGEQELCTSVEAYLPALRALLIDLYDRKKSLREILGIPSHAYTLRDTLSSRKPRSRREAIFLEGIKARWQNPRIARVLVEKGLKPRVYESYKKMLALSPGVFYSLKHEIKKKYFSGT